MNFIESIQDFVLGLPEAIQFLGVALAAMVPFVENYGAVMIGSITGVPVWAVVIMAIVGNITIIALFTLICGCPSGDVLATHRGAGPDDLMSRNKRVRTVLAVFADLCD